MKYACIIGNIVADFLPRCYQAILSRNFRPIFLIYHSRLKTKGTVLFNKSVRYLK